MLSNLMHMCIFSSYQDHIKRLPQDESSAVGLHDPGTRQEETSQRSYLSNFGEHVIVML